MRLYHTDGQRQKRLRQAGFILGLIGGIGFTVVTFVLLVLVSGRWYGELSIFVILSGLSLLVTLAIAWKWELIGGVMIIIETLVLEGVPFIRGVFPVEAALLSSLLYPLVGLVLLSSGTLLILSWKERRVLSPDKRQEDLRRAGFVTGLITGILMTPAYLSGAFGFAMVEQSDLALLLLILLLAAWIGVALVWKWSFAGGVIFIVLGISGLFVIFGTEPWFVWVLPLLANLPIVSLLPLVYGVLSILSWREGRKHTGSVNKLG